jgi:hypothetical protein
VGAVHSINRDKDHQRESAAHVRFTPESEQKADRLGMSA